MIEVINAACGGYCSWHSVIKLSMELIRLKPTTRTFYSSGIDLPVLDDYVIEK